MDTRSRKYSNFARNIREKRNYMRSHIRNQGIAAEGVFFLVGVGQQQTDFNDGPMVDLISEMELYGDFIIGDYVDSYRNLTLKTFSDRVQ